MHTEEEDGVSSRCNGGGEGEGKKGEERRQHDRAPPMGKPPMYFVSGDLVFAGRPREYRRRLTADDVHVCIYTMVARRSMVKDGGKRGRESYLEPRI